MLICLFAWTVILVFFLCFNILGLKELFETIRPGMINAWAGEIQTKISL